nr:hypothetical protein [Tanacetum cinerariifolium]
SNCDEIPSAKAILMANLSSYDSDVLLVFEHGLHKELKEMKSVFKQMETAVAKCSVDKKYFKIEKKELSLDNDRLLEHIICQDVMNVTEFNRKNDMIEKAIYNKLLKRCSRLENRCISLEIKLRQNKESFQTNRPSHNQNAPEFKEFFITNELQDQLEAKNVSIAKLKEHIANLKGKNTAKSVQNVHNSNVVTLKVYKLDLPPRSPCIKNNMVAHVDYLKHTQENVDILREIVKDARELRLLDSNLAFACKFVTHI